MTEVNTLVSPGQVATLSFAFILSNNIPIIRACSNNEFQGQVFQLSATAGILTTHENDDKHYFHALVNGKDVHLVINGRLFFIN
jgi:hypothetical protein